MREQPIIQVLHPPRDWPGFRYRLQQVEDEERVISGSRLLFLLELIKLLFSFQHRLPHQIPIVSDATCIVCTPPPPDSVEFVLFREIICDVVTWRMYRFIASDCRRIY